MTSFVDLRDWWTGNRLFYLDYSKSLQIRQQNLTFLDIIKIISHWDRNVKAIFFVDTTKRIAKICRFRQKLPEFGKAVDIFQKTHYHH